jgi:hypothetical protein
MEDLMAVARWMAAQRTALTPLWAVLVLSLAGLVERYLIDTAPLWQRAALIVLGAAPPLIFASRLAKWWWRWWDVTLTVAGAAWVVWVGLLATDRWGMALGALVAFGLAMFTGRLLNTDLKAKVTVEGEFRDWPEKAKRIGYPDITWVNHKVVPGQGWTAKLVWPAGAYDRDRVVKDVHRFEGARDLPVGSLRLLFHGKSRNSVDAIYVQDDRTTVAVEWPGPTGDHLSAADPVRVGRRADETEVTVARYLPDVGERRILLGGSSGSGKSEMIHNFVGEDAVRDDVVGLGMDLKGGVELGLWDDVLLWMIHDIEGAMQMLAALEAAAVYRQGVLRGRKLRVWRVSPTLPVIHVTVDEIRRLAGSQSGRTGKQQRILLDRLIDVATQGRNVGIGLLAAGQLLTLEALGTSQIRSQFDVRIGLRMNEEESAHYVFPRRRGAAARDRRERPGDRLPEGRDDLGPAAVPRLPVAGAACAAGGRAARRGRRRAGPGDRGCDGGGVGDVRRRVAGRRADGPGRGHRRGHQWGHGRGHGRGRRVRRARGHGRGHGRDLGKGSGYGDGGSESARGRPGCVAARHRGPPRGPDGDYPADRAGAASARSGG